MKVLVTGSAGFLGKACVHLLKLNDYDVTAASRKQKAGNVACDLENVSDVIHLLEDVNPDVIVNCAAIVEFSGNTLESQYTVNTLVPGVFADWCSKNDKYLLHVSTVAVHGCQAERISMSTLINPDTDYAKSKWLAEELIQSSGVKFGIIRFGGIYGAFGPEHLGINRAINSAIKGTVPTIVGNGTAIRNYIHVDDAAKVIEHMVRNKIRGVIYSAGRDNMTVAEMLKAITKIFMPGEKPIFVSGSEAKDQIVETNIELPDFQSMHDALT